MIGPGLRFAGVCPGPANFRKRAGGPLGKFDIAQLHGHFKRRGLQQNVVLGWHLKEILKDMIAFAPGCFFLPFFCRSLPWSQLCQKTRAGGPLGKFDIARLHGHLQQNVVLGWHLKEMLDRT